MMEGFVLYFKETEANIILIVDKAT